MFFSVSCKLRNLSLSFSSHPHLSNTWFDQKARSCAGSAHDFWRNSLCRAVVLRARSHPQRNCAKQECVCGVWAWGCDTHARACVRRLTHIRTQAPMSLGSRGSNGVFRSEPGTISALCGRTAAPLLKSQASSKPFVLLADNTAALACNMLKWKNKKKRKRVMNK